MSVIAEYDFIILLSHIYLSLVLVLQFFDNENIIDSASAVIYIMRVRTAVHKPWWNINTMFEGE